MITLPLCLHAALGQSESLKSHLEQKLGLKKICPKCPSKCPKKMIDYAKLCMLSISLSGLFRCLMKCRKKEIVSHISQNTYR